MSHFLFQIGLMVNVTPFAWSSQAPYTTETNCYKALTSPTYAQSNMLRQGNRSLLFTIQPEPGSLEDLYPGLVDRIKQIALIFVKGQAEGPAVPVKLQQMLDQKHEALEQLKSIVHDIRFHRLVADLKAPSRHTLRALKPNFYQPDFHKAIGSEVSRLWEAIIACLFDGDEVIVGRRAYELPIPRFAQKSDAFGVEIDVAIRKGSHWRWIEFKNWKPEAIHNAEYAVKLTQQAERQNNIRNYFREDGVEIELILLLRYGTTQGVHDEILERTGYDQLLFIFP